MSPFTNQEVAYLASLPAVTHASRTRITYSDAFKRRCVERYRKGESPVAMFREAGMPPELVGYKRIERSFARWRHDPGLTGGRPADVAGHRAARRPVARPVPVPPFTEGYDARDMLIIQQMNRIADLTRQVDELKHQLGITDDEQA